MQLGDDASDAEANQSPVAGHKADLLRRTEELTQEAARLKTLAVAFERWHRDVIFMVAQDRDMNAKSEDLVSRHLIMVSLNAATAAARAADSARRFAARLAIGRSMSSC